MSFIIKKRSFSRLIAVQILYQYYFFKEKKRLGVIKDEVVNYYLAEQKKEEYNSLSDIADKVFLETLLDQVLTNVEKIDSIINETIKKKKEIGILLEQILRFGVLELVITKDVPKNVVVNEYVNITGKFYDKNVTNFVNGVLENIGVKAT